MARPNTGYTVDGDDFIVATEAGVAIVGLHTVDNCAVVAQEYW